MKPDVVHTHLSGLRYTIFSSSCLKKSVKIHTVHNMALHECTWLVRFLHRFAFNYLDWHPVALSVSVEKSIFDVYRAKAPVVSNGVKIVSDYFENTKTDLRKICRVPHDGKIIISIGRLCSQKNQLLLLDAFEKLDHSKDNYALLIVGEDTMGGSYLRKIQERLDGMSEFLRKKVFLLGARKDIQALLSASNLFVLSSDWEGVPLTLLEAMGCGVPIVACAVGGIPDVIESGIDGVLVEKGDVIGLTESMEMVLSGGHEVNLMIDKAKEKFYNNYSIDFTAKSYLDLYNYLQKTI